MKRKSISIITPPSGRVGAGFILRTALVLGCIVLAGTGCQLEEEEAPALQGGEIEFSVSTAYENAAGTDSAGDPESGDGEGVGRSATSVGKFGGSGDGAATDGGETDHSGDGARPGTGYLGSSGNGTPQTRTAYSGDFVTLPSGRYERIDWVDGDRISIWCDKVAESVKRYDYAVSSHTASGAQSHAAIAPVSASPHWGTGNDFVFYAMYPAASTPGVDASRVSLNGNVMRGVIPSVQGVSLKPGTRTYVPDMRNAYMFAATTMPSAGPVSLPFKPMFTAFEFTVDSGDDPTLTLYNAALWSSSHALSGDFTATVTAATGENAACSYAVPPMNSSNNWVHVEFGGGGVTITKGQPITFTLFALPQDMTNLTMVFRTSKGERSVPLYHAGVGPIVFNACQKYRFFFGVPGKLYDFFLTVSDPAFTVSYAGASVTTSVRSYKVNLTTGAQTDAPWQVAGYYADAACTVPYNGNATQQPAWLTSVTGSGTGTPATPGQPMNIQVQSQGLQMTPNAQTTALRAKTEIGTQAAPVDLSHIPFPYTATAPTGNRNTANCYVVIRPGWYAIPLVYGNAIKNGAQNAAAYTSSGVTGTNVLQTFVRHDGQGIVGPWITTDNGLTAASAGIVWQDWPGLVESISVNGDFIHFHIRQDNIHEGNAVIAAKDASGTVLWSWHVWVTAQTLSTISVQNWWKHKNVNQGNMAGGQEWFNFLNHPIGTCLGEEAFVSAPQREVYVKVANAEKAAVLKIVQTAGGNPKTSPNVPLYQWGRKDPMLPADGTKQRKNKTWYNAAGTSSTANFPTATWAGGNAAAANAEIASTIRTPGTANIHPNMDGFYANLWDGTYSQLLDNIDTDFTSWPGAWYGPEYDGGMQFLPTVKTVYDPSPVGFVMPPPGAMSGLQLCNKNIVARPQGNGSRGSRYGAYGGLFFTGVQRTGTQSFFLPHAGWRNQNFVLTENPTYGFNQWGNGGQHVEDGYGFYWTSGQSNSSFRVLLVRFDWNYIHEGNLMNTIYCSPYYRAFSCAVCPVTE